MERSLRSRSLRSVAVVLLLTLLVLVGLNLLVGRAKAGPFKTYESLPSAAQNPERFNEAASQRQDG